MLFVFCSLIPPLNLLYRVASLVSLPPVVESLSGLPSEFSSLNLFGEALGGDKRRFIRELFDPASDNVVDGVKADVVCKVEGSHGVAGSKLHGDVNVFDARVPPVDHEEGLGEEGHEEAVDDEPGGVGAGHCNLVDVPNPVLGGVKDLGVGVVRLDDLHKFHHLDRVEEVDSDEAVGAA